MPNTAAPSDPALDPPPALPLAEHLRALHAQLPAAERRLADTVLARRDALLGYSATELAALAGVSKASAARFFRRLGFADFQAFRAAVRAEAAGGAPRPQPVDAAARPRRRDLSGQLAEHAERDRQVLQRLPVLVDAAALAAAVELLARARRVAVLGLRNAQVVALYAQSLLHQLRPQVGLLAGLAARESEALADLGAGDLLLAVDLRRRTTRLPALVRAARAAGVRVLLLSDAPLSPLEADADTVLRIPTHDAQVFDAYVAPISLVNFLAAALAERAPAAVRQRLARIEALHAALADLEAGPSTINR